MRERFRFGDRDREITMLAIPAFAALIAEPMFLLVDTALVGHLGAVALAGVGLGGAVAQTVVGLLVFLAYGTTPAVARKLGAGDRPGAIGAGIDALWLAVGVGVLILPMMALARPILQLLGGRGEVLDAATTFLSISVLGFPAMLIVLAGTGLLRGLQDTRTPLVVAVTGFAVNAALNGIFIYGFHWGVAGSAIGTVIAQWGMALWLIGVAVRAARRERISLLPRWSGVIEAVGTGGWLLLRTVTLRAALLGTVVVATDRGTDVLAASQVVFTIFSTLAFAYDALAIAGQAMIGKELGAGDAQKARAVTTRLIEWGVATGAVGLVLLLALSSVLGVVFTSDPGVLTLLPAGFVILALAQPLLAVVCVLDGVLIGAGDGRYLALAGLVNLAVYLPLLLICEWLGLEGTAAMVAIWLAFSFGYLGARTVTLGSRTATDRWLILGARH